MANAIPDSVKKCLAVLKGAKSDTEKFAGLFMVTKLVKAKECNGHHKKLLFEAIGFPFLKRLLLSPDVPADCPPQIYKSVAMSILSTFCHEEEIVTHPQILDNISVFLDIVQHADTEDYEDDLIIINEAYECLQSIADFNAGQKALFESGAVLKMAAIYSQQSFQTDEALNVLVSLVGRFGAAAWADDIKAYNALVNVLSLDFETDHSERKFKLCEVLHALIFYGPKELIVDNVANESWPNSILKGLSDILMSKIGKKQRDPALKLASQMLSTLGPEWALQDSEKPRQFFLLLANLSAVEIRMQLEDRDLNHKMENADLIVACFTTLEICISFIALDTLDLEQKEKQQIYTALKGAFSAVITNLIEISKKHPTLDAPKKLLVYSMIRALAAWLAQETTAMREAVYSLLPYMLKIANESFYNFRTRYVSEKNKPSTFDVDSDPSSEIDLLRLLLPALCHLTVEDKARQILLKEHEEEVLFECLNFHWSIVHYKKPMVPKSERNKIKGPEPELPAKLLDQMKDSRTAMISLCNIFMNLTVLEAKMVEENLVFGSLTKFIFNNLPELKNIPDNLVLHGNMAVLGLLLLKQQSKRVKKDDFTICRYIQSTIRFLWDAYSVEESNDASSLVVSMAYKRNWMELMELWFLGMQTLSSILPVLPWISEFAVESGWVQGVLEMLKQVKVGSLPANTKCAYEDFMCHLVEANKDVIKLLKDNNAMNMCRNHRFTELGKRLCSK
ncbi:hypothetical protein V9T40_003648 [Parthenolecanium corni]|uniref:Neurochondrin-like protein n=1 Tax=Parthenolecanium corni TaxID=536013 RepID=A0AAN9Y9X0_9HEMI